MIYIITINGKRKEMNERQLLKFVDSQTSDAYDFMNNTESAEQWLQENGYKFTTRKNLILEYLKKYSFEEVENTDIWKKRKEKSCFYMYVVLNDSSVIIYTQTETGPDCQKTSFDKYDYNKLSKKEFTVFSRMFINLLSFFEK